MSSNFTYTDFPSLLDLEVSVTNEDKPDFSYRGTFDGNLISGIKERFDACGNYNDPNLVSTQKSLAAAFENDYKQIIPSTQYFTLVMAYVKGISDELKARNLTATESGILKLLVSEIEQRYGTLFGDFFKFTIIRGMNKERAFNELTFEQQLDRGLEILNQSGSFDKLIEFGEAQESEEIPEGYEEVDGFLVPKEKGFRRLIPRRFR